MTDSKTDLYQINGVSYTRDELIHRYFHLVKYVAARVSMRAPAFVDVQDLISDGVLGLIDAIKKYDDSRNIKFETYAISRIHGSIMDALRALDWVPRVVRENSRTLAKIQVELEAELGRSPTDVEVADSMGIERKKLNTIKSRIEGANIVSIDEPLRNSNGESISLEDKIKSLDESISANLERQETRDALLAAIKSLPPQEQAVVELYYFEHRQLKDISDVLDVSESRVSQIHARAVVHLREALYKVSDEFGYQKNDRSLKRKYERSSRY